MANVTYDSNLMLAAVHESESGPKAKPEHVRSHVGHWGMSGTVTSGTNPSLLTRS